MTPRENLLETLSGGNPHWMPVCVHIANPNNYPGYLPKNLLEEPHDRLAISEFVGGDILYEVFGIKRRLAGSVEFRTSREGNVIQSTLSTPEGRLNQELSTSLVPSPEYNDLPPGYTIPEPIVTTVHTGRFVKSPGDYKILRSYYRAQTYEANETMIRDELKRVGDKGVMVLGGGPSSPLYSLVANYAGIEGFTYDMIDAPEEVELTMEVMKNAAVKWYEVAAKTSCEVIRCSEDLDTKLISPELFRKYAVPALTQYARICHAHGKLFIIHLCGHIRDFLPDLKSTGVDAIHCLTPPPMGNTTLTEARKVLSGHTAAMLRVDPDTMLHGSAEQIDDFVTGVCEEVGDWHNVLMLIPCGRACLNSIRTVIERVHEKGNWVIR